MDNDVEVAGRLVGRRDWTNLKSVAYVLGATGIFSFIFASGRFAGELASPLQIMFLRYASGLLTVLVIARLRGESWRSMQSEHRTSQALRALAGGLGGAAIIFANAHMPLVDATAISLLSGVFLLVLGVIVFNERLRLAHVVGTAACLGGAAMVMAARGALSGLDASYLVPAAVTVLGALLIAIESAYIKYLAVVDRPLVTLAHVNLFGMLILLIPAALTWQSLGPVNLALAMIGPLAILGQYLNIRGYTLASVSVLAPISYASLIFSALLGWIFFMQTPTVGVIAGAVVIAIGGTIIALSRR
ncbi:MAG TPA: DMT family transporter [Devosiaceae bacterium]